MATFRARCSNRDLLKKFNDTAPMHAMDSAIHEVLRSSWPPWGARARALRMALRRGLVSQLTSKTSPSMRSQFRRGSM
eukprot:7985214-Pyramimonas_sp.AAC.1